MNYVLLLTLTLLLPMTVVTAVDDEDTTIFDFIPVVSQLKSFGHFAFGNNNSMKRTNLNFIKNGIVVSQCRSIVWLLQGEQTKAVNEQYEFFKKINEALDNTPILRNVKEAVEITWDHVVDTTIQYIRKMDAGLLHQP